MSSSHQNKVVSYLKPKYKKLVEEDVKTTEQSESSIVAEIVKAHYDAKNKSVTLSKNHYPQ
jgi:hypothetical protein